jgi:hypothetical protein
LYKIVDAETTSLRGLGLLILTDFSGKLAASLSGDAHEAAAQKLLHLASEPVGRDVEHDMLVYLRRCLLS